MAVIVIGFLGLTMIIPAFSNILELFITKVGSIFGQTGQRKGNDFGTGFITGLSLGIVWSPCAGPILATIATLAAVGNVSTSLVLVTLFYTIGVGIPLFFFAYGGQTLVIKTRFIGKYTGQIQKIFGVIMILTAVAIYTNYDTVIQAKLLDIFPQYSQALNGFESNSAVKQQLDILKGKQTANTTSQNTSSLLNENYQSPEFVGITKWLNPEQPLTVKSLQGKVVLVDFWTYTCINCIRTLPYVTKWYDKYKDEGFVVIGVHTPEFAFEKETQNVLGAIKQYNIHYPVAQDNDYATWNAFNNQYWPAEYLIDAKGIVRRTHFGEGEYDQMEMAIKALLLEKGAKTDTSLVNQADQTPTMPISPETYLGLSKMERLDSNEQPSVGMQTFSLSNIVPLHDFAYTGEWDLQDEFASSSRNASLTFHFFAQKVFLVITPKDKNDVIEVFLDGKKVDASNSGTDVVNGQVILDMARLYSLIDLRGKTEDHVLRLDFKTAGTKVFAFTFG